MQDLSLNVLLFFFFNDTATTEIYTLSLHDALPISSGIEDRRGLRTLSGPSAATSGCSDDHSHHAGGCCSSASSSADELDRKSTRLNSSHGYISYAVFCLKKKK